MKRFLLKFTALLLPILLIGCGQAIPPTATANNPIQPTSLINTPTLTIQPTQTTTITPANVVEPSPTTTFEPSPTMTAGCTSSEFTPDNILQKCIDIGSLAWKYPDTAQGLSGKLIFTMPFSLTSYVMNFDDLFDTGYFPKNYKYVYSTDYHVSPDRNWVAFVAVVNFQTENEKEILVVQSSDGETVFEYPHDYDEWLEIYQWLDNQWLILFTPDLYELDNPILINPFTGEKKALSQNYPSIIYLANQVNL